MDSVILLEFMIHFDAHVLGITVANFDIFLLYSASSNAFRNSSYYFGYHHHHHHHLPPWIRSFNLFRQRRVAIVSWGVRDPFFPGVCRWVAYFGSLVLSILSRWLIQFCLYLSLTSCIPEISSSCLMSSLLILSSLVYPVTLPRKCISAASRRVMSLCVVTHVSLP